ncbi:hypothetical protein HAX54_030478 [Datura stramonium]|uniref:Uncharacterized protein n=1 Tax=Datura stramonium TaxID=4076 RepID=A0ABS8V833_DATST|nr:hypothetical protein [Datura stramonium]
MDKEIVVYLSGRQLGRYAWYRVVLETRPVLYEGKSSKREKRSRIISPAALFRKDDLRINGGWTVIDDDIYWAGGWTIGNGGKITVSEDLLKHYIHHPDPSNWEIVSSLTFPVRCPSLLPSKTWDYLRSEIKHFDLFPTYFDATTVVEEEDQEPTPRQIVFYSSVQGSMLIMDASNDRIVERGNPDCNFAVRSPGDQLPPAAVFLKRTFYYFTYELRLYGYDVDLRRWFISECLANQLHRLKPAPVERDHPVSLLLALPNCNLLLLVPQQRGEYRLASLYLRKDHATSTLHVTVECTHYFHPHGPYFVPSNGKAIWLKNTARMSQTCNGDLMASRSKG